MTDRAAAARDEDAAWVSFETRAQLALVRRFCARPERLFRINPYLQVRSFRQLEADRFEIDLRNLSNDLEQRLAVSLSAPSEDTIRFAYDNGLKRSTSIALERCGNGTRVRITDDYGGTPESERRARTAEVDRSLTAWATALQSHLERERRFGRWPLWRVLRDRVWLSMSPLGRRVSMVLVAIAVAEIALTIVIALVIWLEGRGVT